jgi:SAM-dependent methyltransferase
MYAWSGDGIFCRGRCRRNYSPIFSAGGSQMGELAARVAREKAAYDDGATHRESSALQARFHHVFKCPNSRRAEEYLDRAVAGWAKDKDILDYGCYDGWMTPRYQKMAPASITGLDISETGIAKARASFGDIAKFYAGDAHAMPFPAASFDLVVGRSILHHLDLEVACKNSVAYCALPARLSLLSRYATTWVRRF